jgi:hypothetical protein
MSALRSAPLVAPHSKFGGRVGRALTLAVVLPALLAFSGCATRAVNVAPLPANPADFAAWSCDRIDDELDTVQQRAADVAYAVDERAGNNILALGVGVTIFWPAMLAMRPDGPEAQDLARLKGRYEALRTASANKSCPPPAPMLSAAQAAALPLALGERLVYEDRASPRLPPQEWVLKLTALRRAELEFELDASAAQGRNGRWLQDRVGNVSAAPFGALHWPRLLRAELALGQVLAGDIVVSGDPIARARIRGQVVAVGPQTIAGRRFDAAVIELFGDAPRGEAATRVDGALVIDRTSGVLLRLDLRSAQAPFSLQRRLLRIEAGGR